MSEVTPVRYDKLIGREVDLPSPPVVLHRLHALLAEDASNADIAAVVETDQAFTARILKLVNSPFYGFSRKITSVDEAITMLGLNAVYQLLLTSCVLETIGSPSDALDGGAFWRHSFGVGIIAKHLAHNADRERRSEAFSCGILHDIGRLLLARLNRPRFDKFFSEHRTVANLEAERDFFGIDHQDLGFLLAKQWNFPESVAAVIRCHHEPGLAESHFRLAATVHIADLLCHALNLGDSGNYYVAAFSPEAWRQLDLTPEQLERLLPTALSEIEEGGAMLVSLATAS